MDPDVVIRLRCDADLGTLARIARRVRDRDRYPIYEPDEGLAHFLRHPEPLGAWVACLDGEVVGHVVLQTTATPNAMRLVAARGYTRAPAFVSRLLVDPDAQGHGLGKRLLEQARSAAIDMGRAPYLEAVDIPQGAAALALYRAADWQEIGRANFDLTDDATEAVIFAGPLD